MPFKTETVPVIEYGSIDDVVDVYRSAAAVSFTFEGMPAQPSDAFLCLISSLSGTSVYLAVKAVEGRRQQIFSPVRPTLTAAEVQEALREGLDYLSSLGFSMEKMNLGFNAALREVVIRNIPLLKPVGYRPQPAPQVTPPQASPPTVEAPVPLVSPSPFMGTAATAPPPTPTPPVLPPEAPSSPGGGTEFDPFAAPANSAFFGTSGGTENFGFAAASTVSFRYHPEEERFTLAPADLLELHRSLGRAHVALEGLTAQSCEAYVCLYRQGGGEQVRLLFYATESSKVLVYLPEGGADPASLLQGGLNFVETIGFMMGKVDLPADETARGKVLAEFPPFADQLHAGSQTPLSLSPTAKTVPSMPPGKGISTGGSSPLSASVKQEEKIAAPPPPLEKPVFYGEISPLTPAAQATFALSNATHLPLSNPFALVDLFRSLTSASISSGQGGVEPCDAFVVGLDQEGKPVIQVVLYFRASRRLQIYLPESQPVSRNDYPPMFQAALVFAESIGFIMERQDLPVEATSRLSLLKVLPIFTPEPPVSAAPRKVDAPAPLPKSPGSPRLSTPVTPVAPAATGEEIYSLEDFDRIVATYTASAEEEPSGDPEALIRIIGSF
jgi:hypothetical protein